MYDSIIKCSAFVIMNKLVVLVDIGKLLLIVFIRYEFTRDESQLVRLERLVVDDDS